MQTQCRGRVSWQTKFPREEQLFNDLWNCLVSLVNYWEGTFPSQIHLTFSNPSQLLCNSSMLLKSFSKRKPSQCLLKSKCWKIFNLLKWKYLLSSFSNGVYVLHQQKPSQILLNGNTFSAPSQMKYMFYISSYDLL